MVSLLEKLPPESIVLDPSAINTVDRDQKERQREAVAERAARIAEIKANKRAKKKTRGRSKVRQSIRPYLIGRRLGYARANGEEDGRSKASSERSKNEPSEPSTPRGRSTTPACELTGARPLAGVAPRDQEGGERPRREARAPPRAAREGARRGGGEAAAQAQGRRRGQRGRRGRAGACAVVGARQVQEAGRTAERLLKLCGQDLKILHTNKHNKEDSPRPPSTITEERWGSLHIHIYYYTKNTALHLCCARLRPPFPPRVVHGT